MFTTSFDARTVPPQQGFDNHPPGMWDAQISNTYAKPTANNNGGMFVVEFSTPAGRIENRYNLWNDSPKAVEIANKELSALCHATGIYKLSFPPNPDGTPVLDKAGFELRGARCKIEVVPQTQRDGTPHPNGYMDVKKVYDANGNEPGKSGVAPQPMQQQPQQQQQPPGNGAGWGGQAAQQPTPQQQPPQNVGWGNAQQPANNPPANAGWQQGPTNPPTGPAGNGGVATPPWGAR